MKIKYIFLDLKGDFTKAIKRLFNQEDNVVTYTGNVERFHDDHKHNKGIAYVSPANSLGFMDGGIDLIYSQHMFPGIEKQVKISILKKNYQNILGRSYLPIGSAMILNTNKNQPDSGYHFIVAPTMWLPQNVEKTNNAYYTFLAVQKSVYLWNLTQPNKINYVVCPGLCTGFGGMSPEESAKQIKKAFNDWNYKEIIEEEIESFKKDQIYFEEPNVNEQPRYYQNTEWIDIPFDKIVKC